MPDADYGPEGHTGVGVCYVGGALPVSSSTPYTLYGTDEEKPTCAQVMASKPLDNPCFLAEKETERYISDVADNIVKIERFGKVEVESLYEVDPNSQSFDRVMVQRYGGMKNSEYDQPQSGRVAGTWDPASDYPEFKFEYIKTRPMGQNGTDDATEFSSLPADLKDRYPLEALDSTKPFKPLDECFSGYTDAGGESGDLCGGVHSSTRSYVPQCDWQTDELMNRGGAYCDPNRAIAMQDRLPSFFRTRPWTTLQEPSPGALRKRLYRSRMTCAQIATHYASHTTHNGLIQKAIKVGNVWSHWERIADDRDELQRDNRRICQWTRIIDRDRRERFVGLNYRGQALVKAYKSGSSWHVAETLYNADGLVIEERHGRPASREWLDSDGYMTRTYDEIDPAGRLGYNQWIPQWWMRRFNLLEERYYPKSYATEPTHAYDWDGQAPSLTKRSVSWQGQKYEYEPLFNQLRRQETLIKYGNGNTDSEVMVIDYDYQEMNRDSSEFFAALYGEQHWSWSQPARTKAGVNPDGTTSNQAAAREWLASMQVPVPFYNYDLNEDQHKGFPVHQADAPLKQKVRGFPVRMTKFGRNDSTARRVRYMRPAPHGRPSQIAFEDGRVVDMMYYPSTEYASLIEAQSPATAASTQYTGLLAKTIWHRYGSENLALEDGPQGAPFANGATPCLELKAPFQWMLPGGCGSNARNTLAQELGLSHEVQDELFYAAAGQTPAPHQMDSLKESTSYTYNRTGHVKSMSQPSGVSWQLRRDLDGRLYRLAASSGTKHEYERTPEGWVTSEIVRDPTGAKRITKYQYDVEGQVLTQCEDVTAQACETLLGANGPVIDFDALRPVGSPSYLLTTHRYTAEGLPLKTKDPMGTKVQRTYRQSDGRLLSESVIPLQGSMRKREFFYTEDGMLSKIKFGTKEETYAYDGFGRQIKTVDFMGATHLTAYNGYGQVTGVRANATPFAGSLSLGSHEVRQSYGLFGEKRMTLEPSLDRTEYLYNKYFKIRQVNRYPGGTSPPQSTWITYDKLGQPAWSVDSAQNQQVFATHARELTQVSATISKEATDSGARAPTVAEVLVSDYDGLPLTRTVIGQNGEQELWEFEHNGAGDRTLVRKPDDSVSTSTYNLAGWSTSLVEPNSLGASASMPTAYTYNAYGQVTQLQEPGTPTNVTAYTYNGFGELTARTLPRGQHEEMSYDGYGRVIRHATRQNPQSEVVEELLWNFAKVSGVHRTSMSLVDDPNTSPLSLGYSDHDDYGRLLKTQVTGLKQAQLTGTTPQTVATAYTYDGADRLTSMKHTVMHPTLPDEAHQITYAYAASAGMWQVTTSSPSQAPFTQTQSHDALGRPSNLSLYNPWPSGSQTTSIDFHWSGGTYMGRSQPYHTLQLADDPMREVISHDGLGRPRQVAFRAVRINGTTNEPHDPQWGDQYCLGQWRPECDAPLFETDMKWDEMGRLTSQLTRFRQPLFASGSTTTLRPESARRHHWEGFAYSARGFLRQHYESTKDQTVAHDALPNHAPVNYAAAPAALGAMVGTTGTDGIRWNWEREEGAGDLVQISRHDQPATISWKHATGPGSARPPGHELTAVQVGSGASQPILHDARSHVTQDADFEYAWDALDRLVAAKPKGTATWQEIHHYDAQGRLLVTEYGGTRQRFVYDGAQKVAMFQDGQLSWRAVWGPGLDELIWWQDVQAGSSYLPIHDGQKSVVGLWEEQTASLTHVRDFDPRGRVTTWDAEETVECEERESLDLCDWRPSMARFGFGWHSAWRSELTGLVQMRQRWYSPVLGEFLSHDPLEYVDSHNLYAFAGHDPVNGWDPFGLDNQSPAQKGSFSWMPCLHNCVKKQMRRKQATDFGGIPDPKIFRVPGAGDIVRGGNRVAEDLDHGIRQIHRDVDEWQRYKCTTSVGCNFLVELPRTFQPRDLQDVYLDVATSVAGPAFKGMGPLARQADELVDAARGAKRAVSNLEGPRSLLKWWPCRNSFTQETEVWMCDGSKRPISELEEGDWVLARSVENGEESCQRVERVWMHEEDSQVRLKFEDEANGRLSWLDATLNHPMLLEDGSTQDAAGLRAGQWVGGVSGPVQVKSVELVDSHRMVYNLSVSDVHTFFVGDVGAWAHNSNPCKLVGNVAVLGESRAMTLRPGWLRGRQTSPEFTSGNIRSIKKSMKKDGYTGEAIDVAEVNGRYIILDGHHRARAAGSAGLDEVPVNVWQVSDDTGTKILSEAAHAAEHFGLPW